MKVRLLIISTIMVVFTIVFIAYPSVACYGLSFPNIDAEAAILIDYKTGQTLYEKFPDRQRIYPASTTKIMTAILALEKGAHDQIMTASKAAIRDIGKDGMNIGIMPGEKIYLNDLLNAMLVRSANEAANIIAENICSSREEFVKLMNKRAVELGALHTHFKNPCGAHEENHYTTARDMSIIARHAMSIPEFREITAKKEYIMPETNKHDNWGIPLQSTNKLLNIDTGSLFHITGIKTGYTAPAGFCLVSSAENPEGTELICVVLGVKNRNANENVYKYSKQLLEFGFSEFDVQNIVIPNQIMVRNIPVENSKDNESIDLMSSDFLYSLLPVDKNDWNLAAEKFINTDIGAPVNRNDRLGYVEYSRNGTFLGRIDLISTTSVDMNEESNPPRTVFFKIIKISALIILLFMISRRYNKNRKINRY